MSDLDDLLVLLSCQLAAPRHPKLGRTTVPGQVQADTFRHLLLTLTEANMSASPQKGYPIAYKPQPIDTSGVQVDEGILKLTEVLAKNAHDTWARRRLAEGWSYGPQRDEVKKEHPCLVPYEDLPESEKEYDRTMAVATLKSVIALGYRIQKVP